MRNLKKVLSLVLCVAVMLSVMVLGAGAAFSDQDKIENTEAVNMCSALNIIGGYEDGSFHPERNIKRSEVTKMICVALNGGKDPNLGTPVNPTFSDVRGTADGWAEKYIESCVAQGIVSGVGGGRFAPTGNVTGSQLAKMLLVSLGYKSENEGFTGNAWETNVNVRASQKGLYTGLENLDVSAAVTRDQAAQMVWNALNAYEVEYKTTIVTDENGNLITQVTVQDKQVVSSDNKLSRVTLLEDKYEAQTYTGTFEGNAKTISALKDGQIQVQASDTTTPAKFTYDFDLSYIGEEVSVLFKDGTGGTEDQPDDKDTIYGVVVTGATTVVNATVADIDNTYNTAGKVSINDKAYKVAANGKVVTNLTDVDTGVSWGTVDTGVTDIKNLYNANGDTVKFVLSDKNEINAVYVTNTELYKVTAVSGSKVSLSGIGTVDTAENGTSVYDGIAKDDVVAVTQLYNNKIADATFVIEKAESVTGEVKAFNQKTITVGDTEYKVYNEAAYKSGLTDDAVTGLTEDDLNSEFTLYLVNGYVRAVQRGADNMNNYAIVVDRSDDGVLDSTFKEPKVELLFADGTKKTVVLHKDSKIYTEATVSTPSSEYKTTSQKTSDLEPKQIVKYAEMSNGQYKIEECGAYATSAGSSGDTLYNKDTKAFKVGSSMTVTDGNCVLFYTSNADGDLKATNIRTLDTIDGVISKTYASVTNSDGKVVAAFIDLGAKVPGASDTTLYGIVTTDGKNTNDPNGDPSVMYTIWAGEEVTVYVSGDSAGSLKKGELVSFDKSADNMYTQSSSGTKDFTVLDGTVAAKGVAVPVTEYNEKDQTLTYAETIKQDGNAWVAGSKVTKAIDEDAKIVYIDAKEDTKGDDGMGITAFDGTTGYANALIVYEDNDANKKIVAIIVNTNSDVDVLGKTDHANSEAVVDGSKATVDDINTKLNQSESVKITGTIADLKGLVLPAGKTLDLSEATVTSVSGDVSLAGTMKMGAKTLDLSAATVKLSDTVTVESGTLTIGTNYSAEANTKLVIEDGATFNDKSGKICAEGLTETIKAGATVQLNDTVYIGSGGFVDLSAGTITIQKNLLQVDNGAKVALLKDLTLNAEGDKILVKSGATIDFATYKVAGNKTSHKFTVEAGATVNATGATNEWENFYGSDSAQIATIGDLAGKTFAWDANAGGSSTAGWKADAQ